MRGSSSWPLIAASIVSMCWTRSNDSAVEELVLLLDAERVRSPAPNRWSRRSAVLHRALARDRRREGLTLLGVVMEHRLGLDLDLPGGIEQRGDDGRVRRPDLAEDLAVRAADLLAVRASVT